MTNIENSSAKLKDIINLITSLEDQKKIVRKELRKLTTMQTQQDSTQSH